MDRFGDQGEDVKVVIVGIDDFKSPLAPNLRGAKNDALAWWRYCVQYLKVPGEQIVVLTSPPVTAMELAGPGAHTTEHRMVDAKILLHEAEQSVKASEAVCGARLPTAACIRSSLKSLGKWVRGGRSKPEKAPKALFVYCGHGVGTTSFRGTPSPAAGGTSAAVVPSTLAAWLEHPAVRGSPEAVRLGLVVVPSAAAPTCDPDAPPADIVPLDALSDHEGGPDSSTFVDHPHITYIFDACFGSPHGSLPYALRGVGSGLLYGFSYPLFFKASSPVFLASLPRQATVEATFDGRTRGVFSQALIPLLERWSVDFGTRFFHRIRFEGTSKPTAAKRGAYRVGTHVRARMGELRTRVEASTEVLGYDQTAVLTGHPAVELRPFLANLRGKEKTGASGPALRSYAHLTSETPDAALSYTGHRQVPVENIIDLEVFELDVVLGGAYAPLGRLVVTGSGLADLAVTVSGHGAFTMRAGREYWRFRQSTLAQLETWLSGSPSVPLSVRVRFATPGLLPNDAARITTAQDALGGPSQDPPVRWTAQAPTQPWTVLPSPDPRRRSAWNGATRELRLSLWWNDHRNATTTPAVSVQRALALRFTRPAVGTYRPVDSIDFLANQVVPGLHFFQRLLNHHANNQPPPFELTGWLLPSTPGALPTQPQNWWKVNPSVIELP